MKCTQCEQSFTKIKELRTHYIIGHPGYMFKVGYQRHHSNMRVEMSERAAWDIPPGMSMYMGKAYGKARIKDADGYLSRTSAYRDPLEALLRRFEYARLDKIV
jgi:hypothetical protein